MTRRSPLLLAGLLALLPGCGHKGNPLPPRRKMPPIPANVRLAERGDLIELAARAPTASVEGVPYDRLALEFLYGSGEVDLERQGTRLIVRCLAGEQVVRTLPLPAPGTLLRAVVRAVAGGEQSPRSLTKALVVQAPLEAPRELVVAVVANAITLSWQGTLPEAVAPPPLPTRPGFPGSPPESARPQAHGGSATAPEKASAVDEKAPPSATPAASGAGTPAAKGEGASTTKASRRNGFFVYRRSGNSDYGGPLGSEPLEQHDFKDATAPLGTKLCYVVRAVGSSDPLIESAPSNEACVVMKDITPPAAPGGLAVLARAGGLELVWSPSVEQDLAGYRVFRATAGSTPEKLAELDPAKTSYLDDSARPGVRYGYTVVAFDQAGNQSAPSEVVEAALP